MMKQLRFGVFTQNHSKELLSYLNSFRPEPTADLRRLVFRQEVMDQNFDRQKDFDRDWIRNTVYNLLREYEADSLAKDHLELWLLVHVWSFIDRSYENLEGVEAVRGRRGDQNECSEAGILYNGENDTKLLKERGLKTPKMIKDMFYQLCVAVDWDEQKIRKMESIGFLHAGLTMTLLRLDCPAGYACRISRSKSFCIPSKVSEFGKKALPTILLAWMAKTIVANTICLVEQDENKEANNEEEQLQQLLDLCGASNTTPPLSSKRAKMSYFPSNLDTPQKSQKVLLLDMVFF